MLLPAVTVFVSAGILVPAVFAADMFAGTWRVNVAKTTQANAKSTPALNPPREEVQRIEAVPNGLRLVQDVVEAAGQKRHDEWTVKFDGKQVPTKRTVDGKPDSRTDGETVSATRIDDHTFQFTFTLNGKVRFQARNVISADGKTRRATQTGTSADGQQQVVTVIFDRQ
jgi:hypothetical protein